MKDNSFPSRISLQRIPGRDALWKMAKTKSHIHQQKKTTPTFCPNDTDNQLKAKRATIAPRKNQSSTLHSEPESEVCEESEGSGCKRNYSMLSSIKSFLSGGSQKKAKNLRRQQTETTVAHVMSLYDNYIKRLCMTNETECARTYN